MQELIIKKNISLAPFTTFGIGGPAEFFCRIKNTEQFLQALLWAKQNKKPFFILGGGSNILIADKGIKGLVVKMENQDLKIEDRKVICGSGVKTADLVLKTVNEGLSGLEYFAGLPGTVGGAIYKNSHWQKHFFSDLLEEVQVIDKDLKTKTLTKEKMKFSYDWSGFQKSEDLIVKAVFKLEKKDKKLIQNTVKEVLARRLEVQPSGKSVGSIFKNPKPKIAGILIEESGLKGKKIGGIEISPKHANFFINKNKGKASEVVELIRQVQKKVKDKFDIILKPEIFFQGEFNEKINY